MLSYGQNGPSRDAVTSAELVSRHVQRARFPVTEECVSWDLSAAGIRLDLDGLRVHCGGSDPRYAEIAIMSSSERVETTFFINAAAVPALDPFWMQMSCRAI
jgi:hypothetical protein